MSTLRSDRSNLVASDCDLSQDGYKLFVGNLPAVGLLRIEIPCAIGRKGQNGRNGLSQGLHFGGVACCLFNLWKCHGLRVEFVAECEQLEHDWNSLELEDDFNEWNNQFMLFYAFPHHAFEVIHVHVTPAMFQHQTKLDKVI